MESILVCRRKMFNDNLLDHVVKCEEYISEIKMTISELSECDKYCDGSIIF